jgi:hypothetical protein
MMYVTYYLNDEFVNDIIKMIRKYTGKYYRKNTHTKKGLQTYNIRNLFENDMLKKIIPINNLHKKIYNMWYVKYHKGGYQTEHWHPTEEQSFILYLNNADGDTFFKDPINIKVTPKKGKIILFDSRIKHSANPSFKGKKVLVGGMHSDYNG